MIVVYDSNYFRKIEHFLEHKQSWFGLRKY